MKKYKFLIKPAFFIFNLLFSTWLVLQIEKIRPSDFGKYGSLFEPSSEVIKAKERNKQYLKKLFIDYKAGFIDSTALEQKLDKYLNSSKEIYK